jgi:hypothetical protein
MVGQLMHSKGSYMLKKPFCLISLVGEQPIPNLLPIRAVQPAEVLFVHTQRTADVSQRLQKLFPQSTLLLVDAYDVERIETELQQWLQQNVDKNHCFNLTGGTKTMMLAAYRLAEMHRLPFVYFQTEGRQSLLHYYSFNHKKHPVLNEAKSLAGLITIEDYVRIHVNRYVVTGPSNGAGGLFESAIAAGLKDRVDEVVVGVQLGGALDADLVVRNGNRIGVIEAKMGASARAKTGIDQLNTIGGREFLGTFIAKFLVIDQVWSKSQSNLRELAEARGIVLIELPSYGEHGSISAADQQHLLECLQKKL